MITLRHALQLFPGETTFYMDNKLYTRKQLVALIKKADEDNYPDIIINKISIDTTEFYIRFETNDLTKTDMHHSATLITAAIFSLLSAKQKNRCGFIPHLFYYYVLFTHSKLKQTFPVKKS